MARSTQAASGAMIHIRFAGRSFDVPAADLRLGLGASDAQIKQSLAQYLEVPAGRLDDYVIDRHANGNMTVRPEAVFG